MTRPSLVGLSVVLLQTGLNFPWVAAQDTSATCVLASLQWSFNSAKQSPCSVASSLRGVCNGGSYDVKALPSGHQYLGPSIDAANSCECNTVTYSLMSACGLCQNGTAITWKEWSGNCPMVAIGTYPQPIPQDVRVPGWAYLDVKTSDVFNADVAKEHADAPESTFLPPPSSTVPPTTATSEPISTSSTTTGDTSTNDQRDKLINIIVSSLLGALLLIGSLITFCLWRRRKTRREAERANQPTTSPESPTSTSSVEKQPIGP
ncbi:hypothetical protein AAF712_006511 [Marasmius tenuissimus]|uniref:Uncharacterized protein n=1 Tax=Marasmius tenuissimus TaxID=585030 RepID=A0ABR3A0D0_9AGAR